MYKLVPGLIRQLNHKRILSVMSHYRANPLIAIHEAIQLYEKTCHVEGPNFFPPSIHSLFFVLKYT